MVTVGPVKLLNRASHLSAISSSFSLTISAADVPLDGVGVGPMEQNISKCKLTNRCNRCNLCMEIATNVTTDKS